MAQWLCAVTAVTCLAPTTAAEPDPPSRVVSAGLGFGSFEGFQALVSLRPNRYASVETRAYTAGLFSGADVGLTAHVPVGGGEVLFGLAPAERGVSSSYPSDEGQERRRLDTERAGGSSESASSTRRGATSNLRLVL